MAVVSPTSPEPSVRPEHRREPRISLRLNFTVSDIDLWSSNVSKNGAQLCCPVMRYTGLAEIQDQQLSICWTLPMAAEKIRAVAEVRYANECEDEMLIGLEFMSFEKNSKAVWCDFIDSLAVERATSPT